MCGIAGAINSSFFHPEVTRILGHRGPDEHGGHQYRNVDLLHLRLSILDVSCGKQPMHLDDRLTIVFNGEIYNHQELRKKYNLKGSTFSDTETLLLLYDRFGVDFLHLLDGMFAFVILDKVKGRMFIARDRAGKKPFYYFFDGSKFVFASELNALKAMTALEIQSAHFFQYLRFGTFYRQCTPYKNVSELTAGSFLIVDCNALSIQQTRWWNIHDFYRKKTAVSLEESIEKTDEFLHMAIKRRMESSDLEVGSFLSGGIDSGIVVAIAKQYQANLRTFTVSFEGQYDEAPLARLVADKYGTDHTEIHISFANLKQEVEGILSNYGEPFYDSSAIPSYYVSREAKKYVTVILNGDGADELFGGYRRYVPFARYDFFRKNSLLQKTSRLIKNVLPLPEEKQSMYNYLYRLASLASSSELGIYLSAGVDIFEDYQSWILEREKDYLTSVEEDFRKIALSNLTGLQKIMNLDFDIVLFNDFLVKMDIATMANSLEGRSPFLSREILEYAPSLPDGYKIRGKVTKYLLRKLASRYLPAELCGQPKRGFEIPLKTWLEGELKEPVFDYLSSDNIFCSNFVSRNFVEQLLHGKVRITGEKRAKILWTLFSMEVWYKKVYQ